MPGYKIASSEIVDLPLIRLAGQHRQAGIISTGMASVAEIDAAVTAARSVGNDALVVLSCTACYPADPSDSNLRGIPVLAEAFGIPVGLSDHTLGIGAAVASDGPRCVSSSRSTSPCRATAGGVDSAFSLEPAELAALVRETGTAWRALGEPRMRLATARGGGVALPPFAVRHRGRASG